MGVSGEMADYEGLVARRRMAGVISMALGLPNLILGMFMTFGGIGLAVLFGVLAYSAYASEAGDNPLGNICLVFLVLLLILLFIAAVIFTVISVIFALAMAGQSIGGYFAFRGINFKRAVALIFIGSFVALIVGSSIIVRSILNGVKDPIDAGVLILGIIELISFVGTLVSGILVIKTRNTFVTKKGKDLFRGKDK